MIAGNGALAIVYSGDAVWCIEENPVLAYAVPDEGSNIWFDNIIIPKNSKHTAEAEAFINFLCDAEVALKNTEFIGYSTPNEAAMALLEPEMLLNEVYNPPNEVIERCEVFHDLGEFVSVYNEAWNRIKAA
ncbi:MAG: Spermidine/putrescine-binding periplasmic protein precursor [Firmicutes bacterium ADurb.Bin356]|nr:MAG: Spermidine/putrescine-binding periplasmic protein precursor [Firmicutes bacterium ADurb.Bin356]